MSDEKRHPGGRPTLYDPKYCDRIIELMGQGCGIASAALEMGLGLSTFTDWRAKHPEFAAAIRAGRFAFDGWSDKQARENADNRFFNDRLWGMRRRNTLREGDDAKIKIKGMSVGNWRDKTNVIFDAIENGELSTAQALTLMNTVQASARIEETVELRPILEELQDKANK